MISSEDIRGKILEMVQDRKQTKAFPLSDVARELSPNNWKNSMVQIKLVADTLVKEGKIVSIQNGDAFEILKRKSVL